MPLPTQPNQPRKVPAVCVPSASNPTCATNQAQMQSLTMLSANTKASAKYDPTPTPPIVTSKYVEQFTGNPSIDGLGLGQLLVALGIIVVLYGLVK